MKMSKLNMKLLSIGVFIGTVLIFGTVVALNAGEGGPGSGCLVDSKYMAPPYIGYLTVSNEDNGIYVEGTVSRVGEENCKGEFPKVLVGFDVGSLDFSNLKPTDLRMTCLNNEIGYFNGDYPGCSEITVETLFEVVGVGNIKYNEDRDSFTAHFVIMPLQ